MATDNVAIVRRLSDEIWNRENYDVIDELVAPNHILHDPLVTQLEGREPYRQHVLALKSAFPDFQLLVEDAIASGDEVYVRWVARGTHRGDLLGIASTRKRAVVQGVGIHRFKGGKVIESWNHFDALGLLQQLGIAPSLEKLARSAAPVVARPH